MEKILVTGGSGIFNISTSTSITINQLFTEIQLLCGYKRSPIYRPAKVEAIHDSKLCNKQAMKALQWELLTLFKDGLFPTYEYYMYQQSLSV
ncbi:hypothetical protein [Bacillus rhizoplanae]|uniref:hypothetical protein n=1 Tax=Bacillus rhizoplanae TaxID=2880966 RepID=UPI003D1F6DA1